MAKRIVARGGLLLRGREAGKARSVLQVATHYAGDGCRFSMEDRRDHQ